MAFDRSLGHRWPETYDRPVLDWFLARPSDPTIRQEATKVVVTFASGILQSAEQPTGPWGDVDGATSPHAVPLSETGRFFRMRL